MLNVADTSLVIAGVFSKSPIFRFVLGVDVRKAVPTVVNASDEESNIDAVKSNNILEDILIISKKFVEIMTTNFYFEIMP